MQLQICKRADICGLMTMTMPTPNDVERRASGCGLSIPELCRRSGTPNSSFYRWRAGTLWPNSRTIERWLDAIAEQEANMKARGTLRGEKPAA